MNTYQYYYYNNISWFIKYLQHAETQVDYQILL